MKAIMQRLKLDRWIDEGAPMFWVLGMSAVLLGAVPGVPAALTAKERPTPWRK
jgi:hypothetical protein